MAYKKFMDTLNTILMDVSLFKSKVRDNLEIPADLVVQSMEDYDFAGDLVSYIKSGSYLGEGVRADNARLLLANYKFGTSGSVTAKLANLTLRQAYAADRLIEDQLELSFPTGLQNLWVNRDFETIKSHMNFDTSKVSTLMFHILSNQGALDYVDDKYKFSNMITLPDVRDNLKRENPEEFINSCVTAMGIIEKMDGLVRTHQVDFYNLFTLLRALENDVTLPIGISTEIISNDKFSLFGGLVEQEEF